MLTHTDYPQLMVKRRYVMLSDYKQEGKAPEQLIHSSPVLTRPFSSTCKQLLKKTSRQIRHDDSHVEDTYGTFFLKILPIT